MNTTYTASQWTLSDGSILLLEATVNVHISDIQVTLTDALNSYGGRTQYWQRTALIDWVGCHQQTLRNHCAEEAERENTWDYDPRKGRAA